MRMDEYLFCTDCGTGYGLIAITNDPNDLGYSGWFGGYCEDCENPVCDECSFEPVLNDDSEIIGFVNEDDDCDLCVEPWIADNNGICLLPEIDNCEEHSEDNLECVSCEDGFFYASESRLCIPCDLQKCAACKRVSGPNGPYSSCTKCEDGFALTKEYTPTP